MAVNPSDSQKADAERLAAQILEIADTLARELHPEVDWRRPTTLDSRLDRDLGLDSLAMAEWMLRLEQDLGVTLGDEALLAESPRELLQLVLAKTGATAEPAVAAAVQYEIPGATRGIPTKTQTLPEMLEWHVKHHADRVHVYLYEDADRVEKITYRQLHRGAQRIAAGLRHAAMEPGQSIAIMLPTERAYLESFFGVLIAGCVPVPIYPPARRSQIAEHLRRHSAILDNAAAHCLITVKEAKALGLLLTAQVPTLQRVITPDELARHAFRHISVSRNAQDIAFLQYTSGSTGDPKGVVLTHANLLNNIFVMGQRIKATSTDLFVSWLPLYHDMGLIGAWLGSMYFGFPLVLMSPVSFLAKPSRWLRAVHRHRATLTASPNFGYELCLRKIPESELEGLDLSSLRIMFNGAEPVSPETVGQFNSKFAHYGLNETALMPVYGLAESSVGLAIPPPGRGALIDRVSRDVFYRTGQAVPAAEDDPNPLLWMDCGSPLRGEQIRIVDDSGVELPDRREGRIEFKGPSATSGYYRNPEATRRLFRFGDWRDSGDRGYMAAGELFITGREKDVIIRAGRNIYPYELEEAIGEIPGIRKGCVAVFPSVKRAGDPENLIVVAETRETSDETLQRLRQQIHTRTVDLLGVPADEIILSPPHTVLKTSSGKLRRSATRQVYERGTLGRGRWGQAMTLLGQASVAQLRRAGRNLNRIAYSAWAWLVFFLLAPFAWLAVLLLPRMTWRWAALRLAGRILTRLTGTRLTADGLEHIPATTACVLAANHSSYLDSMALVLTISRDFRYVAKREYKGRFHLAVVFEPAGDPVRRALRYRTEL